MTKKINHCLIAISATAIALPAFSQSKNFEGSSVSLGLGSFQLKDAADAASKKWNGLGNLEFTKFQSLDDSWLLGFGVGVDLGTSRTNASAGSGGDTLYFAGDASPSSVLPGTLTAASDNPYYGYQTGTSRSISRKNNFSISFLPGYAFTKNDMGYLRVSFNRAKFTVSGGAGRWLSSSELEASGGSWPAAWGYSGGDGCAATVPSTDACTMTSGTQAGASGSKFLNGVGLGVGYRRNIGENLFFQAEYKYEVYEKSDLLGIKPKDQGAVLSLGYRF